MHRNIFNPKLKSDPFNETTYLFQPYTPTYLLIYIETYILI